LQDEAEASGGLDPRSEGGEWALDLCAAPGGKAAQIAEMLGPTGA